MANSGSGSLGDMMARIKIIGLASGEPSPIDGHYIKSYNASGPNTPGMLCHLETTPDPDEALDLSQLEMVQLWRSVDKRDPIRADGRPNRPLTAFTVMIT